MIVGSIICQENVHTIYFQYTYITSVKSQFYYLVESVRDNTRVNALWHYGIKIPSRDMPMVHAYVSNFLTAVTNLEDTFSSQSLYIILTQSHVHLPSVNKYYFLM